MLDNQRTQLRKQHAELIDLSIRVQQAQTLSEQKQQPLLRKHLSRAAEAIVKATAEMSQIREGLQPKLFAEQEYPLLQDEEG